VDTPAIPHLCAAVGRGRHRGLCRGETWYARSCRARKDDMIDPVAGLIPRQTDLSVMVDDTDSCDSEPVGGVGWRAKVARRGVAGDWTRGVPRRSPWSPRPPGCEPRFGHRAAPRSATPWLKSGPYRR